MTVPPGWPREVPDPESPEFPARVTGWLLDLCPPEYRGHEVLRRYPVVLSREGARLAAHVREVGLVEEALQGRRWRPKL